MVGEALVSSFLSVATENDKSFLPHQLNAVSRCTHVNPIEIREAPTCLNSVLGDKKVELQKQVLEQKCVCVCVHMSV